MTMEQTINRNLLRYAVQTAIFCANCQHVLDVSRAVHVDATKDGKSKSTTLCTACYEQGKAKAEQIAAAKGIALEILDGRDLFPSRGKR